MLRKLIKSKFYYSIGFKFIMAFLIPIVAVIIIGYMSYKKSSDAIINSYRENGYQSLLMVSDYTTFGLGNAETTAFQYLFDDTFSKFFNGFYKSDIKQEATIAKNLGTSILAKQTSDDFISGIHFIAEGKNVISTSFKSDTDIEGYYQSFIDSDGGKKLADNPKATYWLGDDDFLSIVLTNQDYAIRYIKGFQTSKACVIVDVSTEQIKNILRRLDYGNNSILGFITEDNKEIIETDNIEFINRQGLITSTEFYQKARANTEVLSDWMDVEFFGQNYLFIYSILEDSMAMVFSLIPEENILKEVETIKWLTLIATLIAAIIVATIALIFTIGLQQIIAYINNQLNKVAQGDLSTRLKIKRKDEFAKLVDGTNHMVDNMRDLITKVKSQIVTVTGISAQVKNSSHGFLESTKIINNAIDEIQIGINEQATDSTNCLMNIEDLSTKIDVVNGKTTEISSLADDTIQSVVQGMKAIHLLASKAKSTTEITSRIKQNIGELNNKSAKISKITTTIDNIASETNLLSLNASIEAARAGEAGKGFAVVASEIRKLADQCAEAVGEIEKLVLDIQKQTNNAVHIVDEAEEVVLEQEKAVIETENSFRIIDNSVEKLVNNVHLIKDNINVIQQAKTDALASIERISAVSEQTASASYAITEITEQQVSAVQDLGQLADNLDSKAKELEIAVAQFVIEEDI